MESTTVTIKWIWVVVISIWISNVHAASGPRCELLPGNLLQDPLFEQRNPEGVLLYWRSSQHSGEPSFDLRIEDGEADIEKIGTQPWFFFRQSIDAREFAGKKMVLNVELKLDLVPPKNPHPFKAGGGVKIVAKSGGAQGRKMLLRSILDHQPHMGTADWHPVQIVIQVPGDAATMDVGFLLQADGSMRVRNPVFQEVDESAESCELSPNTVLGVARPSSGLR